MFCLLLLALQAVKLMGTRDQAAGTEFSGILDEDVEQHLK
jgi:hypothetical protein